MRLFALPECRLAPSTSVPALHLYTQGISHMLALVSKILFLRFSFLERLWPMFYTTVTFLFHANFLTKSFRYPCVILSDVTFSRLGPSLYKRLDDDILIRLPVLENKLDSNLHFPYKESSTWIVYLLCVFCSYTKPSKSCHKNMSGSICMHTCMERRKKYIIKKIRGKKWQSAH